MEWKDIELFQQLIKEARLALQEIKYKEATKQYSEVASLSEKPYGKRHHETIRIQVALAEIYWKSGSLERNKKAVEAYIQSLAMVECLLESPGSHSEIRSLAKQIIHGLQKVTLEYHDNGNYQDADELYSRIYSSTSVIFGMDNITFDILNKKETNAQHLVLQTQQSPRTQRHLLDVSNNATVLNGTPDFRYLQNLHKWRLPSTSRITTSRHLGRRCWKRRESDMMAFGQLPESRSP